MSTSQGFRYVVSTLTPSRTDFNQRKLVLVKYEPYVPQCIQFGTLLDPTAQRFVIKGAPLRNQSSQQADPSQQSEPSQISLKIKPSRRQVAAQGTQKTDSQPTEQSLQPNRLTAEAPPSSSSEAFVKDSFMIPSSDPAEQIERPAEVKDRFNDALSQAIKETMALAHLPLDDDDDDDTESAVANNADDENEGTDEESPEPAPKPQKTFNFVSKSSALRDNLSVHGSKQWRILLPESECQDDTDFRRDG
jgi:DNA polymerase IV